ncbi:InlB B-repeat-containing protein [Carboxylicivirga marina]|uniref:InlB B-repeat-containing protein n=1 Tax=Carboxylicivirga marina TaxID=2800988 RepID=A0ABS1HM26_9BACT|nr:InlB B-repeat-containing protein [Carboxylicivirga marina]MBK3518671.1 InlB B-repeat-containing protein [Carboxylicivirga marina]
MGYVLDWSSEALFNGVETEFIWYNHGSGIPATAEQIESLGNGQFRFLEEGSYYCTMTNDFFPGTTLTSEVINIGEGFTVTFLDWDGAVLKTEQVVSGGAATAPANPSRTGYTFTGWDVPFNNITDNLTVNAVYTINQYAVTFVDWDGSELKTEDVNYGGAATAPAEPTRTGYTFTGWDVSFNNIIATLIVTAEYEIIEYTVEYRNMDGASNASGNPDSYTIETAIMTLEAPTKSGFTFDGWFEDELLTQEVTTIARGAIGNLVLWAKWTVVTAVDNSKKTEVEIYPMPIENELNISGAENVYTKGALYSLSGKMVKQFNINESLKTISMVNLEKGVYILRLSGKNTITKKVVKR